MHAHIYQHPEFSIHQVRLNALYLVPSDRTVFGPWRERLQTLLDEVVVFHEREFGGVSKIDLVVHPQPVIGLSTHTYRARPEERPYFHTMADQAQAVLPAGDGSHTVWLVFADWGMRDNADGNGEDTYIARRREPVDVSDILHVHGCCGAWFADRRGVGVVTEEAWKHPEIPGSAIVVYHEGLGHPLNMPHTDSRQGVMGQGQYAGIHLLESVVEPEILRDMIQVPPADAELAARQFAWYGGGP